ncbi:FERM and PDZ domain-containing protein 1, partial [Notothenia coriiceps]|uniref:FERM and PDZ domain-containing protein 1 n=1 Tax=Notothenia coriiceps TaxID=8208 RepID=A0A6I9ML20_9TELE
DIVMTLKEKLSLSRIEHFSLVLEQQHSITKLLLLHDEERIQQVVQKKEAHDYRCLFRVCFLPKSLHALLQEDPAAFEYLYLQGVNDVLQERFAIEMRCNTALRLAALHIQERLASCGHSQKTNLKMITKTWGIENFVSSTLLRNMREKDLKKAITYHMKKSQSQNDPKQKGLSVDQTRINYLEELCELKSFGGKSFSATMMLQDRESMVTLLVGARYGVSQVVNHKLSILSTLTEFTCITRIELLPESDKVSLVKIYLQDIKPITLLLESAAAKDMSCLIAGYCQVFVDPNLNIFPWIHVSKKHRVSAEEGYVSRCGSDSDTSSDLGMDALITKASHDDRPRPRIRSSSDPDGRKRKDRNRRRNKDSKEKGDKTWEENKKQKEEKDADTEKEKSPLSKNRESKNEETQNKEETEKLQEGQQTKIEIREHYSGELRENVGQESRCDEDVHAAEEHPSVSEASDSLNTDSRVITSPSSDSLDALEEDDLVSCSSSFTVLPNAPSQTLNSHSPLQLHHYSHNQVHPHLLAPPPAHAHPLIHLTADDRRQGGGLRRSNDRADPQLLSSVPPSSSLHCIQKCPSNPCSDDSSLCFAELSLLVDFLPSPPEASDDDEEAEEELRRRKRRKGKMLKETGECVRGESGSISVEGSLREHPLTPSPSSSNLEFVFNFDQSDARCYYKLCSNITPDSARSLPCPPDHNEGGDWVKVKADPAEAVYLEPIPILQPPPGFGDSSSDEEFFDARDRFTSPVDPALDAIPRDIRSDMKLDFHSALSLSDISVSVADEDRAEEEKEEEEDKKDVEEEGGGIETLFQLRKRSRKRRSFMETDFTSTVSFPEPDPEKSDQVFNRLRNNMLADSSDAEMLSLDPEPSEQTQNPCPTVSSLNHSEGEPAQLESKPILSKPRLHGCSSPCGLGSHDQSRDPSRSRKQEMEMEPDAMESKSVTDLVKAASPTITIVRCRMDPDEKEERKEKVEMDKGKDEEEETSGVSGNGPFINHMFLPEYTKEGGKGEEEKTEGVEGASLASSDRQLIEAQKQPEANTLPTRLKDVNAKSSNGLFGAHVFAVEEHLLKGVCENSNPHSYSPPPPPPTTPLPVLPKSQSDCFVSGKGSIKNTGSSTKMSSSNSEMSLGKQGPTEKAKLYLDFTTRFNEDTIGVSTPSDEVTDSTNSDNVFDDDELDNSLNSGSMVTTQNLNGPGLPFHSQSQIVGQTSGNRPLMGLCRAPEQTSDSPKTLSSVCKVFTICEDPSKTKDPVEVGSAQALKTQFGCNSLQESVCESVVEGLQVPLDACGCPTLPYTNCFGSGDSFDEELTVYEFSCRTQNSGVTQTSGAGLPLITSPPVPSFLSTSSTFSPSFPRSIHFSTSTSELSPLLSPLSDASDNFQSQTHKDTISGLGQQRYPEPPTGFQVLRVDVDQLLTILESSGADRSMANHGGRHPRDTCPAHFTENKRLLQIEARRLMSGCQKVVGIGQSPEEMLLSLANSFRTLVELAGICLWFSGCERCDRRNAEAVAGLADVARSFRDFCLAAERASSKRSCQDLSTKLLAKQCTALTASVFCLTQLFRTLTAL